MRQRLRATLLLIAALLMGFAAVVNAIISVPHLRADMTEINVRPTLLSALSLGLYFGTFAMSGFALVVLAAAVQASRGLTPARPLLAIIAAIYVTFGGGAFLVWNGSAHTLGYVLMGVLIGLAVALPGSPSSSPRHAVRP
jgi:drug/metabolite transporter (DMT)-like permease